MKKLIAIIIMCHILFMFLLPLHLFVIPFDLYIFGQTGLLGLYLISTTISIVTIICIFLGIWVINKLIN